MKHIVLLMIAAAFMINSPLSADTVLVANFLNGNTDFFRSRIYIWNPNAAGANITARVFSSPRSGPSELLGTADLGQIEAETSRTLRLEDILALIGVLLPYRDHAGNINIELTVTADNVRGTAQVFDSSLTLAFGTYPLQVMPSLGSPPSGGSSAFQVLSDSVFIDQGTSSFVSINGAVTNNSFGDATFVKVAIAAFDSSGTMLGGDVSFISGDTRKQGSFVSNSGLLQGGTGYFSSFMSVNGSVASADFFVVADQRQTTAPLAQVAVTSSQITSGSFGADVSGSIRNNGTTTASFIFMDIILLDSQGRVLEIDFASPDQTSLTPGASTNFSTSTFVVFSQVASVVFSVDWSE